ncbi:MAG: DJ-1/PfpI family protein [Novosphingobium sp.]|uniref:DJ-1/PfpI family protein n=1 Tax=Novosphingobium sp. TaxID=1874826 RepID=UPI001D7BB651|nr:DJ-1/PfpI family protein [Novosphingobium sp.]MCB2056534.1 DJ-1/PfpI family protein [Novosphingobium sp.]MCP5387392.1 DJ-1/PfpI family protein [Novosphingobium sp.]
MPDQPFTVVFAIYPGMTHLDFTGPHQFISRMPNSVTIIASPAGGEVPADGLVFAATVPIAGIERCDLLCVPGGSNALDWALDPDFVGQIRRLAASARYVTSVCTGSLILGAAGLLSGKRAACHWAWRDLLPAFGAIPDPARVVREGNLITGGGVTAGIDFALTVLAEIGGDDLARTIQLGLEYAPAPPFDSGRPELAPPALLEAYLERLAPLVARREAQAHEAAARLP